MKVLEKYHICISCFNCFKNPVKSVHSCIPHGGVLHFSKFLSDCKYFHTALLDVELNLQYWFTLFTYVFQELIYLCIVMIKCAWSVCLLVKMFYSFFYVECDLTDSALVNDVCGIHNYVESCTNRGKLTYKRSHHTD